MSQVIAGLPAENLFGLSCVKCIECQVNKIRRGAKETRSMNTLFSNALVDKIIKAVRDLADAVTPRPAPVPVPIPVRNIEPPIVRR